MMKNELNITRGQVYYADLSPVKGSEQGGYRPVVIVQNDTGNKYSTTTIICTMTTKSKKYMPTHVTLPDDLYKGSRIEAEQIRTIDKCRLKAHDPSKPLPDIPAEYMAKLDKALKISLGL